MQIGKYLVGTLKIENKIPMSVKNCSVGSKNCAVGSKNCSVTSVYIIH